MSKAETGVFFVGGVGPIKDWERLYRIYEKRLNFGKKVELYLPEWQKNEGLSQKAENLVEKFAPFAEDVEKVLAVGISAGRLLLDFAALRYPGVFNHSVKYVGICSRIRTAPETAENNKLFRENPDYQSAVIFSEHSTPYVGVASSRSALIFGGNEDEVAPVGSYELPGVRTLVLEDPDFKGHEASIGRILALKGQEMLRFLQAA